MTENTGTLSDYCDLLKQSSPAYLDLLTVQSDQDFDRAVERIVVAAITGMEKNSRNFKDANEEALSAILALAIMIPDVLMTHRHS